MKIWIVQKEGFVGDLNACLGVAYKLGVEPKVIYHEEIKQAGGLQGYITNLQATAGFVDRLSSSPYPDLAIASHIFSTDYMCQLKTLSKGATLLLNLRDPGGTARKEFFLIANPSSAHKIYGENVIETTGISHKVGEKQLLEGKNSWQDQLSEVTAKKPVIAVMLGGSSIPAPNETGGGEFTIEHAEDLGKQINTVANILDASLLITNSNRTPQKAWEKFSSCIQRDHVYLHDYRLNASRGNPYFGLLSIADVLIPSADSMSMCSEACSTGKPVYIAGLDLSCIRTDHKRLAESLIKGGYAMTLEGFVLGQTYKPKPLDAAKEIANEVIKKLALTNPRPQKIQKNTCFL